MSGILTPASDTGAAPRAAPAVQRAGECDVCLRGTVVGAADLSR
jgi:hypothetical protein